MKKFLVLIGAALILGACGGGGDDEQAPVDEGTDDVVDTEEEAGDDTDEQAAGDTYDPAEAQVIYEENCMSCHGGELEGNVGPAIAGLSADDVVSVIESGAAGMPANIVEGEEKEMVAQWISEQ